MSDEKKAVTPAAVEKNEFKDALAELLSCKFREPVDGLDVAKFREALAKAKKLFE
jgi:hypothetical protein